MDAILLDAFDTDTLEKVFNETEKKFFVGDYQFSPEMLLRGSYVNQLEFKLSQQKVQLQRFRSK